MSKLTDRCLAAIRSVPILDVASRYTHLKKAGQLFVGLSPFKSEKTPSFTVYVSSNRFVCYSSGHKGGVIDLVMLAEGLSFVEAAEALASRSNIALEYVDGKANTQRSARAELLLIHEIATTYYREHFAANDTVRAYWTRDRGFLPTTAEEFQIGFAPSDDGHELARRVMAQRVSPQAIRDCGLFHCPRALITEPSQLLPRFSGRLMIPIHDPQGHVCAFAGRQIPGIQDRTQAGQNAKYLNSPETPLFTKGKVLFNLHRARAALREAGDDERFLLVEGQLDVMRLWETGRKLAVAPQGTAVTTDHLATIARYPNGVRCLMDGDAAGGKAALRLIPMALETETDMVFTPMPVDQDPDSLFKGISPDEAQARFRVLVGRSFTPVGMAVEQLMPKTHARGALTPQAKATIVKEILHLLAASPSAMTVWYSIEEAAKALRVEHLAVWHEFIRIRDVTPVPPAPESPPSVAFVPPPEEVPTGVAE